MANNNVGLGKAKVNKKDEFNTQLNDIANEMRHYAPYFKGKTVLCNCDDPRVSNFFQYFALKFHTLGLKKLITTCYKNQDADMFTEHKSERAIYLIYEGDKNGNGSIDPEEIGIHYLKGDGDFRSKECLALLEEADIIVTNPPFSLFRQFVKTLFDFNKKFILIGHQNSMKYKDIFPLMQDNKMWLGYGFKGGAAHFISRYEDTAVGGEHIEGMIRVSGVVWFTNLPVSKRNEELVLTETYTPERYPKYGNYDAIDVEKSLDIPKDYYGLIGVPITFFNQHNPNQFEIIGNTCDTTWCKNNGVGRIGEEVIAKLRRQGNKSHVTANMHSIYLIKDGKVTLPYARMIIKRKV